MIAAILLHIAGALKHHFIDKDSTLARMWFGASDGMASAAHKGTWAAPMIAIAVYVAVTIAGAAGGLYAAPSTTERVALAQVSSDWAVTEGEMAVTITQFNSPVMGRFADWTAAITFDENASGVMGDVTTTIAIGSLTLGSVTSQALGADFFDVETFPTAVFVADIVAQEQGYVAEGTMTIKDITLPLSMPFELTLDGDTAEMAGRVTIDRRSFEIGETMADETNLAFAVDVAVSLTATRNQE